jgi:DNA adenine methylase
MHSQDTGGLLTTPSQLNIVVADACLPGETAKPFLKWAGAKTRVVRVLRRLMPSGDFRLIEPFVGSGAVFLNAPCSSALLADTCNDVINVYDVLRAHGEAFIEKCRELFTAENNTRTRFDELRCEFNGSTDPVCRAQLFVYLNRHCYNGLCRFNQGGAFNTPFGRYEQPHFPAAQMRTFAAKLAQAELRTADFRETIDAARTGDVVYCDPPYLPLRDQGFTQYSGTTFSLRDHEALAALAFAAAQRGATVLVSNHDSDVSRKLYCRADAIHCIQVSRTISRNGDDRRKVDELIAVFGGQ